MANNRVAAGNKTVEGDPKSETSRRTLPLPNRLTLVLKAARKRQAAERLALGGAGGRRGGGAAAHQAARRQTHLRDPDAPAGAPVAVIAAWIGHKDASLTMRLYAHSQFAALQDAGASLDRVVTLCDTEARPQAR